MGQNVSVRTIATASQIVARTGLAPTESRAVLGSGIFSHVFRDVDAVDAIAHIHSALSALGDLVPRHAIELEPDLLAVLA
jgi:hypothetical protein